MRLFAIIGLLAVLAGSALGQSKVAFDSGTHLPGWDEVTFGEFADLHELEPFTQMDGRLVTPAELEELIQRWQAERKRVEALLAAERGDPKRWFLFQLDRALAKHPFFAQISWERIEDPSGLVILVQKPKKEDSAYAAAIASKYAGWMLPVRSYFAETYAEPHALQRREDHGAEAVFVLASLGDLEAYFRLTALSSHYMCWGYYDAKLRMAVLAEDPFEKSMTRDDKRRAARHLYAHVLLHAHYTPAQTLVQESWLYEGLASDLANLADGPDGKLQRGDPPKETLRRLVAATQAPATALTNFQPIAELLVTPTYQHLASRLSKAARDAGRDPEAIDMGEVYNCYCREAMLLVDYLQRADRAPAFATYLARELRGEGGKQAFQEAFSDPVQLERRFLEHLYAEHKRLFPEQKLDERAIESLVTRSPLASTAADGAPPPLPPRPPFEPAELAPRDLAPEAALALALDLARRGRSDGAAARLSAMLDQEPSALDPGLRARLERERDRLLAWSELRNAWFQSLAERGESYRFDHEGKAVRAKVLSVEGAKVALAENRAGRASLDLEALDPLELAKAMKKDVEGNQGAWVRVLPYALQGEKRVDRMLDPLDPPQAAFVADLTANYPALLARGRALGDLTLLAEGPVPTDPAAARQSAELLGGIARERAGRPEIEALLPKMREYARLALEAAFEERGPAQLVRGKWEALPGERVRLTYDFEDPAQLEDFVRDDGFLAERHRELALRPEAKSQAKVESGRLAGLGRAALRHKLGFGAPMRVRWKLSFEKVPEVGDASVWFAMLGICESGGGRYAAAINYNDLEVSDEDFAAAYENPRLPTFLGHVYDVELAHGGSEGGRVGLSMDGTLRQELPAGALRSGGFFILFHTEWVAEIDDLAIEAEPDAALLARAREAWVSERLAELGL